MMQELNDGLCYLHLDDVVLPVVAVHPVAVSNQATNLALPCSEAKNNNSQK
jgi:hypothetical protein